MVIKRMWSSRDWVNLMPVPRRRLASLSLLQLARPTLFSRLFSSTVYHLRYLMVV